MATIFELLSQRPPRAKRDGLERRKYSLSDDTHARIVAVARKQGCYTSTVIEALVDEYLPKVPRRRKPQVVKPVYVAPSNIPDQEDDFDDF